MKVADFNIEEKVMVVAEIGNNHEGNFEVAAELVEKAAECGVDAVKFQTFKTEHYVTQSDADRFARLKSFELTYEQFGKLSALARAHGLLFISTPFDLQSAEFLGSIVDAFKIASGDNNFYPLIAQVSHTSLPLIVSSGASDLAQVLRTVEFIGQQRNGRPVGDYLAILHCVSSYPVPLAEANLRSISFIKQNVPCAVGYSDHTIGNDAAIIAVALGARIIEKHFTLDHNYSSFRDHQISADPKEMADLVGRIKNASMMLGSEAKTIQACEQSVVSLIRRSIVAGADLPIGHRIQFSDLTWIRPAGDLAPGQEDVVVGKQLQRSVKYGEQLNASDVK